MPGKRARPADQRPKKREVTLTCVKITSKRFAPHSVMFVARISAVEGQKKKKTVTGRDAPTDLKCTVTGWLPSYSPGIEYRLILDEKNAITTRLGWRRNIWWMTDSFLEQMLCFEQTWGHADLKYVLGHFKNDPMTSQSQLSSLNDVGLIKTLLDRHFCPEIWFDLACVSEGEKNRFSPHVMERRFGDICAWQADIDDDLIRAFFRREHPVPRMAWQDVRQIISLMRKRREGGLLGENDLQTMKTVQRLQEPDDFSKMMKLRPVLHKEIVLVPPPESRHDFNIGEDAYEKMYSALDRVRTAVSFFGSSTSKIGISDPEVEALIREHGVLIDVGNSEWTTPECRDSFGESPTRESIEIPTV